MTPDTKGQPEPVAYKRRLVYSDGLSEGWVLAWNGSTTPKSKVLPGTEEEIRPLYDVDVPALLARQEKLVEALEALKEVVKDKLLPICQEHGGKLWLAEAFHIEATFSRVDKALAVAREES